MPTMTAPGTIALSGSFDDQLASRLLHQRIVVLGQEVDDPIANRHLRAAAAAVRRGPARRHQPLHQLPGRLGLGRAGHLRHHAADPQRRQHPGDGPGRQHGPVPALRRHPRQAVRPAARPDPDAPGLGRHRRHRRRHRDPGREPRAHQGSDAPADRRAHRPGRWRRSSGTPTGTAGSPPRRRGDYGFVDRDPASRRRRTSGRPPTGSRSGWA